MLLSPAAKAEEANLAEKPGGDPVLKQHKGVLSDREILGKSPLSCGRDLGAVGFFKTKMQQDATRNPTTSFGLNLASALCCYAAEALKLPISHN